MAQVDANGLNFALSVIKSVQPKDQIEAMLASHMAAVHVATIKAAGILARVETIPQQDSAERVFNTLTRTFTMQLDAAPCPYRSIPIRL